MRILEENPAEDFLRQNKRIVFSAKRIRHHLGISHKHAFMLLSNSKNIRKCDPMEVGSGKNKLHLFTWVE